MDMPYFLRDQAVSTAICGKQVIVISRKGPGQDIDEIESGEDADLIERVCRANGNESIEYFTGGRISYFRTVDAVRGMEAEQVYFKLGISEDEVLTLIPSLQGARDGSLIGYY